MKVTFGRKFYAGLFAIIVLIYFFTLAVLKAPDAVSAGALIFFGGMVVTVCFMYIGGNVWKSWIKSKYFNAELHEISGA